MVTSLAIGLGIVVVGALVVGAVLFGHRSPAATAAVDATTLPASVRTSASDVNVTVARRITSALLLVGLTVGLAGLLAALVGAAVFLGGLAMGS